MLNAWWDEAQAGIKIARRHINNLRYADNTALMAETLSGVYTDLPMDFPGGTEGKLSAYNAGDLGSIPGLGRSPGEGNGNPLQYSCLENPMDRGAC